jgi:hypothetical protein
MLTAIPPHGSFWSVLSLAVRLRCAFDRLSGSRDAVAERRERFLNALRRALLVEPGKGDRLAAGVDAVHQLFVGHQGRLPDAASRDNALSTGTRCFFSARSTG